MRQIACMFAALGLFIGVSLTGRADSDEAGAIIDKAIKAHVGDKDGEAVKKLGYRGKNKGTITIAGQTLEFTQEVALQLPDKFKESMDMNVMGQKIHIVTVFDGKQGWIKVNDMDIKVGNDILEEFKDVGYVMGLSLGIYRRDKSLKYSLLGEVKVNDKPAIGIKVSKEGRKEIDFYFDKGTFLTAKVERRTRDFMTGQEVGEERIILEYKDIDGRKTPKKVEVKRDGKKFLDAEVLEVEVLDKIDDSEFARP